MRQRGFTYIEILVSLFLVSASIAIIGITLPVASNARGKTALIDKAMSQAQKELELVRGLGYASLTSTQMYAAGAIDNPTATATSTTTGTSPVTGSSVSIAGATYSFTSVDTAVQDSPAQALPSGTGRLLVEQVDTDVRRVTVTITWSDRGTTRSYSTGTIVANL